MRKFWQIAKKILYKTFLMSIMQNMEMKIMLINKAWWWTVNWIS